jgi:hypothetical protein
MAYGKIKTEMKGTGGGRWTHREDAKKAANRKRREANKQIDSEVLTDEDAYYDALADEDDGDYLDRKHTGRCR